VVAWKRRVVLTGARPGKWQVAPMARLESTEASRKSSRQWWLDRAGVRVDFHWGGDSGEDENSGSSVELLGAAPRGGAAGRRAPHGVGVQQRTDDASAVTSGAVLCCGGDGGARGAKKM
jgi:hypothetical protein